jgi:hypothetical protein
MQKSVNIKNQGSGNGRWSGGENSYYENHYQRKLNRKQKLKDCDNKCEGCGKPGLILNAHSVDGDKNNHDMTNLKMLCAKCLGSKSSSKYKRMFGSTLMEMTREFGVSLAVMYKFVNVYTTKTKLKNAIEKYKKDRLPKNYDI